MVHDFNNETKDEISAIYNEVGKENGPMDLKPMDQGTLLRNSLSHFVIGQINSVKNFDEALKSGIAELKKRIEAGSMNDDALMKAIGLLSGQKTSHVFSILDPFKATGQSSSPLLPPAVAKEEQSNIESLFNKLPASDLQALELVARKLRNVTPEN